MSKAIAGAAMLGAAVLDGVAMYALASTGVGAAALPFLAHLMEGLVVSGISMEAGAIASELTSNRGMGITTRQPASARQVTRGMRRTGGVEIYRSTTGSHHDQFNYVIVIQGKPSWAIQNLYLDGRQVFFQSGVGNTTQNGVNFGGSADGNNHTGPNGVQYNFGGLVYCEAKYGNQVSGDVIGGLTANDPNWAASSNGNPYVGGCTYVYLKVEYNPDVFPSEPEIKFTLLGTPVYDPRNGSTVFTSNWALHVADHIQDPLAGFADTNINQDQLIAAANICDEQLACAAGTESRYAISANYDTTMSPGSILNKMMDCAAGRVRYIGGEWYIFPGAWPGPSFSFDESSLCGGIESEPVLGIEQLCNRVTGTYCAPNVPYNIDGNLYDSNGYYDGQIQNNFPFAWQPTSAPQYARDQSHGYASPQDLLQDSGSLGPYVAGTTYNEDDVVEITTGTGETASTSIWRSLVDGNTEAPGPSASNWVNGAAILQDDLQLDWVISVSQWQRLAKIHMMRKRYQGRFKMPMFLTAYRTQPLDVINMTLPALGWQGKVLEVDYPVLRAVQREGEPPALQVMIPLAETDPSIYAWSETEEQNVYSAPVAPTNSTGATQPPTGLTLTSSAATAVVQPNGQVSPQIQASWTTPLDAYVADIDTAYRLSGTTAWTAGPSVSVANSFCLLGPVVAGQQYDVRIRSRRTNGAVSVWVEQDAFTARLVLSVQTPGTAIGPGSLIQQAFASGAAAIICTPFSALVGGNTLSYFPGGNVTLTTDGTSGGSGAALKQQTLYYVYVVDAAYAGGNLTPVATTNQADYVGKIGYFLIDSIVTGFANSSGSSNRYAPSKPSDTGTQGTQNPQAAFDGDLGTSATVGGSSNSIYTPTPGAGGGGSTDDTTASGAITYAGFPALTLTTAMTLTVVASATFRQTTGAAAGTGSIVGAVGGTSNVLWSDSAALAQQSFQMALPSGTDLSDVSVTITADPGGGEASSTQHAVNSTVQVKVVEIYVS